MNRSSVSLLLLGTALLTVAVACGQPKSNASAPATPPPVATKSQKFVKVATINGAAKVQEFQRNVQVLHAQRKAALDLQASVTKETDAKKKKELQAKLDAALAKLNEDNTVMAKTYGFSITRNYTMEIETANIYVEVSDEEAAKVEAQHKAQANKTPKK